MASKSLAVAEPSVLELVGDLERAGAMNAVSLTLDTKNPLPFEQWESLGRFLGRMDHAIRWWIGDWLNFGEEVYGEDSAQAVESTRGERYDEAERVTGLAPQTLMNISSVCRRIAKSRRRPELYFSTHEVVASLEPDEQKEWLDRAVTEEWSSHDLRAAIYESQGRTTGASSDPDPGAGGLTNQERLEAAARLVFYQGQPQRSGDVLVPGEAWTHLASALGE
jgi:hypothetical protein